MNVCDEGMMGPCKLCGEPIQGGDLFIMHRDEPYHSACAWDFADTLDRIR